ncbi:hypothetical protein ACVWXS_002257 [Lysinibacillus sp. TE18511]
MRLHDFEMNLFSKEAIKGEMKVFECDHDDVEMVIDIAELSSLVTVQALFMLSKVKISDGQYLHALHQFSFVLDKPTCITAF